MGAWGPAIFSDDTACDVRDAYRDSIGEGIEGTEATRRLLAEWDTDDMDQGPVVWLALAATQWRLGRLEDAVRDQALRVIEDNANLPAWMHNPKQLRQRERVLATLKEQLLSPQPPPKRVRKPFREQTLFAVGDVVSYRLASGNYALLHVAEHYRANKHDIDPIVEVLDWTGNVVPDVDMVMALPIRRPLNRPDRFCGSTRFILYSYPTMRNYPAARLNVVAHGMAVIEFVKPPGGWRHDDPDFGQRLGNWKDLDWLLDEAFDIK